MIDSERALIERVVELERELKEARMFIAALVKSNGGELLISDYAFLEVGSMTIMEVSRDNRTTRVRVS